ncbi:VTC domain-containing protein [Bacteroidota bacterium]
MSSLNNNVIAEQVYDISSIKRYELKYTIDENLASEIRDYLKNIFVLDSHVPPGEKEYIVNNLYFDTNDLKFYYDTKFRKLTRYKPRVRYYGEKATDLIWPEVKYRNSSVIWKRRYSIPISKWPELSSRTRICKKISSAKEQLDSFDDVIYWYNANPVLHVRYHREPYVTELESYGRITFDRRLACRSMNGSIELDYDEKEMLYYDDPVSSKSADSLVILEIKVETLVPSWAIELIHTFNLMQRPYSKYCYGLDSLTNFKENGRLSKYS